MNPPRGRPARRSGGHRLVVRSGARAIAADVVARVLDDGAWAQPTLAAALAGSPLDARDKALATELAYGTLRWAVPLERSLLRSADKPGRGLDARIRPHLLVAAYQLQHLNERIPAHAAVSEAVDAVRSVRPGLEGFANALLRRLGSPLHELLTPRASLDDVADAYGIPRFLAHDLSARLTPDAWKAGLGALNARPTTWAVAWGDVPAQAVRHPFVPGVYSLEGGAVTEQAGFDDGAFVVMDPGSVTAALLVDAAPGQRVLDLCAAPGGKTAVLARAVRPTSAAGASGKVIAVELQERRAQRIRDNVVRLKVDGCVDVRISDARTVEVESADAVLLDAPCTGLGTTRRKPEIKLRRSESDVAANAAVQRTLLARAVSLTRPGGVVVYSVCSPVRAEGAEIVESALTAFPELDVEDARAVLPWLPSDAVDTRGCIQLLPHRHDADAFFCARLRKKHQP